MCRKWDVFAVSGRSGTIVWGSMFVEISSVTLDVTDTCSVDPRRKPANAEAGKIEHFDSSLPRGHYHIRREIGGAKGFRLEHKDPREDYFRVGPEHTRSISIFPQNGAEI